MILSQSGKTLIRVVCALVLVFFNACFVAGEFAFVKARRARLQSLAVSGNKSARIALAYAENLTSTLSSTQLGTTLTSLALGWVGEGLFASTVRVRAPAIYHSVSPSQHILASALSFTFIAVLHAVLGELVPKSVGIQNADQIALYLARPLRLFFTLSQPCIWFFSRLSSLILSMVGRNSGEEEALSESDLKLLLQESTEEGIISTGEALIMNRAFAFADKLARDIMVPAEEVDFLCLGRSVHRNVEILIKKQRSRFPLCDGGFENIVGIAYAKDIWPELFDVWPALPEGLRNEPIQSKCRPAHFVSDRMRQDHLLRFFQERRAHMAIVRDSAGKNIGIVTLEDIVAQLVGENAC